MNAEQMSTNVPTHSGAFISEMSADALNRRAEEILGLPVVKGKTWNVEVTISPGDAKAILLAMPPQRSLSALNVRYFAGLIKSGRFRVTHQGIAFDKDGKLIDGMHRLTACVQADAAIAVQATFNMDRELFDALDRGRTRSHADDILTSSLASNAKEGQIISAATKILWLLDRRLAPWTTPDRSEFQLQEMREVIERHPYVYDCASFVYKHQSAWRGIGMAAATAYYTVFREKHYAKADQFMEQVALGENLRFGDPAYAFREYKRHIGSAHGRMNRGAAMIVLVRAWNAFVEGRSLNKVSSHVRNGELFPEISKGR